MKTKTAARASITPGPQDRKFWTEFLVLYQSQSSLWDMGNENYKDRCAKIKSYDLLKDKLREHMPGATRDDVLRRINIFRTNYRRERMRALKYRERGNNYQTSLWYFKLLSFLEPQILVKSRTRSKTEQKDLQNVEKFSIQSQFKTESNLYDTNMDTSSPQANKRQTLENDVSYVGDGTGDSGEHGNVEEIEDLEYFFEDDGRINEACSVEIKNNDSRRHDMADMDEVQYKYTSNIGEDFEQSPTHATRLDEFCVTDEDGHDMVMTRSDAVVNSIEKSEMPYNLYATEARSSTTAILSLTSTNELKTTNNKNVQSKSSSQSQQQQQSQSNESNCQLGNTSEILARSWAVQYDEMTTEQKIYARKEIADILFAGCMGTLGLRHGNS